MSRWCPSGWAEPNLRRTARGERPDRRRPIAQPARSREVQEVPPAAAHVALSAPPLECLEHGTRPLLAGRGLPFVVVRMTAPAAQPSLYPHIRTSHINSSKVPADRYRRTKSSGMIKPARAATPLPPSGFQASAAGVLPLHSEPRLTAVSVLDRHIVSPVMDRRQPAEQCEMSLSVLCKTSIHRTSMKPGNPGPASPFARSTDDAAREKSAV